MKLDKRLSMVASLVRPCDIIADIGTDHAYVPVYLIENRIVSRAYAGDVRVGPLDNAKRTIEEYEMADKIMPILSDGLQSIPHDTNDFIIAGMGGELIARLLSESRWVEQIGNHFVLQPQTHPEDLRLYLYQNGYEILKESVCQDGHHLYLAIEAQFTGTTNEISDLSNWETYIGKLENSPVTLLYLNTIIDRLNIKYNATKDEEIKQIIDKLSEVRDIWQQ